MRKTLFGSISISLLLAAALLLQASPSWAQPTTPAAGGSIYLPLVFCSSCPGSPSATLVADHRYTDIHQIPDYWLEQAKKLVVHYAHTSHGSQVLSGLEWLESRDPKYIEASGTTVLPSGSIIRTSGGCPYPPECFEPLQSQVM